MGSRSENRSLGGDSKSLERREEQTRDFRWNLGALVGNRRQAQREPEKLGGESSRSRADIVILFISFKILI